MRFAFFALAIPLVAASQPARAQGATAEDLFHEGVSLFGRGEVAAACERFERSYKLDAAPGTLFNLANCHEKQGRLWRARLDFLDLVERATAAGKLDKAQLARDRLVAVEAKLPKISFVFVPQSNATSIAIDDAPLAEIAWHSPAPVDAGSHVIDFRAPGKVGIKRSVVTPGVSVVGVQVPSLAPRDRVDPSARRASPCDRWRPGRYERVVVRRGSRERGILGCAGTGRGWLRGRRAGLGRSRCRRVLRIPGGLAAQPGHEGLPRERRNLPHGRGYNGRGERLIEEQHERDRVGSRVRYWRRRRGCRRRVDCRRLEPVAGLEHEFFSRPHVGARACWNVT
jgi:hypothetical protein